MITLITGAPGSGKTLFCVDKIIRPLIGTTVDGTDNDGNPSTFHRTVFTNINGLLLDHVLIDGAWLENLATNREPGCVVVFDEVQRVWPNRPVGSKKPPAVEYLETHRHDGIDVVLLTQNPQLLDPAVRKLIGRHLHMRRVGAFGAAIVYEWDACSDTLRFKNAFTKTPYRFSRAASKLYTSARVHTKQKRRLPFAVWMALFGVIAAAVMWPSLFGRLFAAKPVAVPASSSVMALGSPASPASAPASSASLGLSRLAMADMARSVSMSVDEYLATLVPRSEGLPHTAPRYDQLTQPTRVPYPAACIQSESSGCQCWSQDATVMDLSESTCLQIIERGLFLDFVPDREAQSRQLAQNAPITPQTVAWSAQDARPYQRPAQLDSAPPAPAPDPDPPVQRFTRPPPPRGTGAAPSPLPGESAPPLGVRGYRGRSP
jgi:zona occludens toxin